MAAPSTPDDFLDLVRKSGVVDEKRLEAYLEKVRAGAGFPEELGRFAGVLVRDGILTHFQAEQFLQGKWRRFTIGKYKVLERLGSGGMGSVYLCEHKFMRRRVAVKVLPAAKAEDPAALERFYREARAVAALDHPNIVRAYDIDQDDKLHFLVMEYVDGASLQEVVKKHGPMDVLRAAHYLQQSAIGLHHAHSVAGLVHRDIKPGNLLVDRNGVVKILDMGLARFFHDEEDILTKKYDENVLGTADYLAPEQALDSHGVDIRADIYSLGATFYYVLSGNTPFTEGSVAQKLIWHQTRQPKAIRGLRPEVSEGLAAVLEKMMAKDPGQRYQTPAELAEALVPFTTEPIAPPPEREMPRLSPAAMGLTPTGEVAAAPYTAPLPLPPGPVTPGPRTPVSPMPVARQPASGVSLPRSGASRQPPSGSSLSQPASSRRGLGVATAPVPPAPTPDSAGGAGTRRDMPAVTPQPQTQAEPAPSWEAIAPRSERKRAAPRPAPATLTGKLGRSWREQRKAWIIGAGAAVAFLAAVAVCLSLLVGKADGPGKTVPPPKGANVLKVKKAGDPEALPSVRDALARARPGDRILLQDEAIEETLLLQDGGKRGKGVTIEGAVGGKPVLWTCPDKADRFVAVTGLSGLTLKNIRFDGRDRVHDLVMFMEHCPGCVLENVTLTGFKRAGLVLWNCSGKDGEPLTFQNVTVVAGKAEKPAAVSLNTRSTIPIPNQYLAFRDCRMEGPFQQAVLIDGTLLNAEFRRTRVFDAADGFRYKSAVPPNQIDLTLDSNTFCQVKQHALLFETPPDPKAANQVVVSNNLFVQTAVLARIEKPYAKTKPPPTASAELKGEIVKFLQGSDNVRDPKSQEGNVPLGAAVKDVPALPTNPQQADFLIYPKDSPLAQLPRLPGVAPE